MKQETNLVDRYLESLDGMSEAHVDPLFYARTRARLERAQPASAWALPLRPVWLIGTLALLLLVNGFMLQDRHRAAPVSIEQPVGIMEFMNTYDQSLPSIY